MYKIYKYHNIIKYFNNLYTLHKLVVVVLTIFVPILLQYIGYVDDKGRWVAGWLVNVYKQIN